MKQPIDTATPELHLDGQPVFDLDHDREWPMPPVKAWVPRPAAETAWREALVRAPQPDPAAEPNPIAAAFTRLMTWSQR
jgi:hypothetical protein